MDIGELLPTTRILEQLDRMYGQGPQLDTLTTTYQLGPVRFQITERSPVQRVGQSLFALLIGLLAGLLAANWPTVRALRLSPHVLLMATGLAAAASFILIIFIPKLRAYRDDQEFRNLVKALGRQDAGDRLDALIALAIKGPQAAPALPAIVAALGDSFEPNRQCAARALGNMGAHAAPAVSALVAALREDTVDVRSTVALALGRIGPPARQAIEALRDALEDSSGLVRTQAALALWRVTKQTDEAAPVLAANLKDADADVRRLSARALSEMGLEASAVSPNAEQPRGPPSDGYPR